MKIFYDHQAFSSQNFGGVSRIFSELIVGIPHQSNNKVHLPFLVSNNIYLEQKGISHIPFFSSFRIPRKHGVMYKLNQAYNGLDLKLTDFDLYHPSYYDPGLIPYVKNKPIVATFHDMTHERLSHKYPQLAAEKTLIQHKKSIAEKATHIIAVSENTKKDVVEILGVHPDKISVVHLGNSFSVGSVKKNEEARMPYLLYVGNRGLYKNFLPFLEAVAPVLIANNIQLKCAGGSQFTNEESAIISQLKLTNFVNIESSTTDKKLASLYSNALAFAFPSLYEGFGIPIVEAFACDCPCILSSTSSLPEVAKDAAIYFDPVDKESIKNVVEKVISSESLRKELILKGRERLKHFSWHKHVSETISVYEKI